MNNYKLLIAYDGTAYHGWQIQPNGITIQEVIQKGIKLILRQDATVIGSGRTDAGVHAKGQVAHFKTGEEIDIRRFQHSLNGVLPKDIRILSMEKVSLSFHAQKDAISKIYHYHLFLNPVLDPFKKLYCLHLREKLDLNLLREAASLFVGKKDFTSFSNEAHKGACATDPVRTLERVDLVEEEGGIRIEFQADGFLYKMVRNITGCLLEVASHKIEISEIPKIFEAKDRKAAGQAAPGHPLFLMSVLYTR